MISVIVPALNESQAIAEVVAFARRDPSVAEVIVVDDGSIDGTPDAARAAGATVITSTLLGKGASMEDGLRIAAQETVLYLDGDLSGLHPDLVARMTQPIEAGEADFVKARFSRAGGRVTALTAQPLLKMFFPELAGLSQPLGGIVAGRRTLLRRLRFENDYGVDIGLLIDAFAAGARIEEADIGHLRHDSQPLEVLGDMAMQVVRTILDRAVHCRRFQVAQIREAQEVQRQMQAEFNVVLQRLGHAERLALFDMDGVLLDGRFVVELARRTSQDRELERFLDRTDMPADDRTRRIAELFRGVTRETIERAARELPLIPGAAEAVVGLRRAGYRVGIVTDSYHSAAEIVRRRVFADFSVAHLLRFRRGQATGGITLSPAMAHPQGCPEHYHCKLNALRHLVERLELPVERVLAVGDGENDVCMLRAAGTAVAFRPKCDAVRRAAGHVVEGDLTDILAVAGVCAG